MDVGSDPTTRSGLLSALSFTSSAVIYSTVEESKKCKTFDCCSGNCIIPEARACISAFVHFFFGVRKCRVL